jgi:predicted ArsR family transcriptional regulator
VAALEELGSMVDIEDDGAKSGKVRLRGYSCPLASAVPAHPEVCRLIESLLAEVVGAPVKECCNRDARPRCGFEFATGRRRAA